ncbi:hypothetical protein ECC02_001584 [Trypanosoma cruzi]|uniref:Mic1 domain-containing protein n=1 Tax=Trypanosoma cruzi TaxID=5693 RepID=A0A7J6YG51_TRYCR|nr:hypothetical protein ECC02_001584 [Trypanosoma cruzi]
MTDVSTVPPFMVFRKPVFRFCTTAAAAAGGGGGAGGNDASRVTRIYIDEVANDVVVFSRASRQVCFYQLRLREGPGNDEATTAAIASNSSLSQPDKNVDAVADCRKDSCEKVRENASSAAVDVEWMRHHPALPADAIALTVSSREGDGELLPVRYAKRCPIPLHCGYHDTMTCSSDSYHSGDERAYLVALSIDTRSVLFVLCHAHMGALPLYALATFQCAPKSLRFRDDFYPIQAYYWAEELHGTQSPSCNFPTRRASSMVDLPGGKERQQHERRNVPDDDASSLTPAKFLSAATSRRRILLCVTTISLDLVGVDEELLPCATEEKVGSRELCVLLRRFPTHSDYWHYCPAARTLLSVNRLKSRILKSFEASDEGLRPLPALRLQDEDSDGGGDEDWAISGGENSEMSLLFSSPACMDRPSVRYPVGLLVLYRQLFLCSLSRHDGGAMLYRYLSAENGSEESFVRYALLRPDFSLNPRRDPVALQVIDNLVVLHVLRQGISCAFDVACGEREHDVKSSLSGGTSESVATSMAVSAPAAARIGGWHGTDAASSQYGGSGSRGLWASLILEREEPVSWITRITSGLRGGDGSGSSNNVGRRSGSHARGGGYETFLPVLQPSLSAALMMYPPLSANTSTCIQMDDLYSHAFVYGTLPLLLDRCHGTVHLVGANPFAIAATMPQTSQRVQFYLHRQHCAGGAVQSLLQTMLSKQESLDLVAHAFEIVTTHHATQQLLQISRQNSDKKKTGTPSWAHDPLFLSVTAAVIPQRNGHACFMGSTAALRRCLPVEDEEGPLPCEPPWRRWGGVTLQDFLSTCMTSFDGFPVPVGGGDGDGRVVLPTDVSIGQLVMQREVFAPLVDVVLVSPPFAGGCSGSGVRVAARSEVETATAKAQAASAREDCAEETIDARSPNESRNSKGQLYFARYLFYALFEYASCVMRTGLELVDELQRLLIRLLHAAELDCGPLRQLLLPGMITDQVPTAMVLLPMGGEYRRLGIDMLLRLRAHVLVVQVLLAERRPLDAMNYVYANIQHSQDTGDELLNPRVMNDILQCALDAVVEGERNCEGCGRNRRRSLEFIIVFEMITGALMQQPSIGMMLPPDYHTMRAKYMQLLAEGPGG